MMVFSLLRISQLLLCFQLITADLRIRDLQLEVEESQTLVGAVKANATLYPGFTFFANGECAGTLISPSRVLTSASCVQNGHPATVRIGASSRTNGRKVNVRCAKSHPLYVWPNFQYDIAVLKLEEPVTGIAFPILNPEVDYPDLEGFELSVIGMGRNGTAGYVADNLMEVKIGFVPDDQCKTSYGDKISNGLHVCAKGIRKGACFGDAGGPVFDNQLPRFMVGVVTGASGGCADNKVEDVYADVAAFLEWIETEEADTTCNDLCVGCFCGAYERFTTFRASLTETVGRFLNF